MSVGPVYGMACYAANKPNEDGFVTFATEGGQVFAVVDGHGGFRVRDMVVSLLPGAVGEAVDEQGGEGADMGEVLQAALSGVDGVVLDKVKSLPYPTTEEEYDAKVGLMEQGACVSAVYVPFASSVEGAMVAKVAHLGDTRIVAGSPAGIAHPLCGIHNASEEAERARLLASLPKDKKLFTQYENGKYYLKGIVQVTRAIGDGYLKDKELAKLHNEVVGPKFKIKPLPKPAAPYMTSVAELNQLAFGAVAEHPADANPAFLVAASDGVWDLMTDGEVTAFVAKALKPIRLASPRRTQISTATLSQVANALIEHVLAKVAAEFELSMEDLKSFTPGAKGDSGRRSYHDDITVAIIILPALANAPPLAHQAISKVPSRVLMPVQAVSRDVGVVNTPSLLNLVSPPSSSSTTNQGPSDQSSPSQRPHKQKRKPVDSPPRVRQTRSKTKRSKLL